ncbi:MAG TPA: two-component regulator propeller domain-containing protein [Candidatus Angelobacter sp.]|nr:two-component regulator propeller domain-containing protein [Candidatus Angelobacter sp.]
MSPKAALLCVLILSLLAAFAQPLLALNPESRISQYGHTVWRVQDGNLNGSPTAFAQTPDGYIWIGTQNGLYRFDGVNFLLRNPPAGQRYPSGIANIQSLYAARDGSLWVGTSAGLAHWANGTFSSIPDLNAGVAGIAEDTEGAIWITRTHLHSFTGPICKISAGNARCYGEPEGIQTLSGGSIAVDAQGRFWIGGNGTLVAWQGKLLGEYPLPGAKAPNSARVIEGVAVDAEGVWVGVDQTGPHDGLQHFAGGRWSSFTAPGFNGANVNVRALFIDRDRSLWVGTSNQGIYRIHGQSVDHFGHEDGLSSNSIDRIFQDREGSIWVSTDEGLDHFRDLPIVTYSSAEGLGTEVVGSILARRNGTTTIGTLSSIDSLQGTVITSRRISGLRGIAPALLEDHRGNLWISTADGGLGVEVNGRLRLIFKGDSGASVFSLAEDTDQAVWALIAGPHPRLVRIENFEVREEFKPKIPAGYCVTADPQGGIWLSLLDGRLMRYLHGEWQELSVEPLKRKYSRVGGIYNMSFDSDGTLWGAANSGVVGYRNGNLQFLNERNGLPCPSTYATVSDVHHDLWIQTQCGLVRIENAALERWWRNPESRLRVTTFTTADGFRSGIPYSHPGAVRGVDGKLWFQNARVLMMVDPDHLAANAVVPPVHLEQVIADRRIYDAQSGLRLPPRTQQLQIDYTGLSYVAPSKVLFRYRLDGYDTQWQEPETRRTAFYNDLRPGNYTFRVIASNNSGRWNDEGASLQFSIAPAYYQTYWFRAMWGAVLVVLVWALYQFRLRQMMQEFNIALEARVNERTRIARELHDTLLQSLHGLMFQYQAARNMLPRSPEDARKTLDDAIFETEQAIAESRDAIHDLRTQPLSEGDLAPLLETAGEEMATVEGGDRDSPGFRVIVEGEPRKLSPNLQDEVYRIACEVLRNAFRHAEAGQIEAEIRYDKSQLRLRIRDDGKGIDPKILEETRRPGHWGLPGVRERAQCIGSQLSFWSQAGAGTEVELTIPASIAYEGQRNGGRFKALGLKALRKEWKL